MENQPAARADASAIEAELLRLIAERGPDKTVDPTEAARALGGTHPDQWGPLMQPIRRVARPGGLRKRTVVLFSPHDRAGKRRPHPVAHSG